MLVTLLLALAIVIGVAAPGFHGLSFDTDAWVTLLPFDASYATERGDPLPFESHCLVDGRPRRW